MVERYTDLKKGLWRVVLDQSGRTGRVEESRTGIKLYWEQDACGIWFAYPDPTGVVTEGFVPRYVIAEIDKMCKLAYKWLSLKKTGVDYGHCTVTAEEIDSLVEMHEYQFTDEELAYLKANKVKLTEMAVDDIMEAYVDDIMEAHWIETLGEATERLLDKEITK